MIHCFFLIVFVDKKRSPEMRNWRFVAIFLGFICIVVNGTISGVKLGSKEAIEDILKRETAEDEKFPENVRKKRQISRTNFQQYLANMGKVDYDVRYEEGEFQL